jgi:hypothetical protein
VPIPFPLVSLGDVYESWVPQYAIS